MTADNMHPFDPDEAIRRLRQAVRHLPAPSMFQLRDRGFATLFQQTVACMISVRTYEEVSLPASIRLFEVAATPESVLGLSADQIDALISPATFHERKAAQILTIARVTVEQFGSALPCDEAVLLSLPGIGPKCTALALGIACHEDRLPVDIHVHRVANRWGVVRTNTPEQTQIALEQVFPSASWLELNERLVPFGKSICTRLRPVCSTCLLLDMCQQTGVRNPR
ncbi:MAG: endonuclease III [Thermomicrobiales bacterium]|nr:endonuclease III [Thermomicrobiales bacterium]